MVLETPVNLYIHTHWDREWYEPFRVYQHRLIGVVDKILDLLESNTIENFTLDGQVVLLEDYFEFCAENKTRITHYIQNKKLSIGPWYVMPDEFLVSGEALMRNLKKGIEFASSYGQENYCGYLPDTFGHSADIPLILNQFGIKTAVVWRGVNPKKCIFKWQSLSGDSVMTLHLTQGYFQNSLHMAQSDCERETELSAFVKPILEATPKDILPLIPVGADHLGIDERVLFEMGKFFPKASTVLLDQHCELMLSKQEKFKDSIILGELVDCSAQYILPGVYSARTYLKQANRQLEWKLARQLEPLIAISKHLGDATDYQSELNFLWELLLLNHPHDSICGCSVDSVHRENEHRFEQINQKIKSLISDIHIKIWMGGIKLAQSTLQQSNCPIVWVNLSHQNYTGVAQVTLSMPVDVDLSSEFPHSQLISEKIVLDDTYHPDNTVLPLAHIKMKKQTILLWVEQLPHYGFLLVNEETQRALPGDKVIISDNTLENNLLKLTVEPNGLITVLDKCSGQTHVNLHRLCVTQQQGDSYNGAPIIGSSIDEANLRTIQIIDHGPLRGGLRLHYQMAYSGQRLKTDVVLDAGASGINFKTTWDNQFESKLIQVGFESSQPIDCVLAEGHYNPVVRKYDPDYQIEMAMPAAKFKELKTNTGPIQRWIQWQNQVLITKGLCEYEVKKTQLLLTLHRGFEALSSDSTGVRGSQAGPPLLTPDAQCLNREMNAEYFWSPCSDSQATNLYARLTAQSDIFYGALYGIQYARHTSERVNTIPGYRVFKGCFGDSNIHWSNPNIVLTAIEMTTNGMLFRVSNPTNTEQTLALNLMTGFPHWNQVNALGQILNPLKENTINIGPYGLINLLATY